VNKEKIFLKCGIKKADELIYLDSSLINPKEVSNLLRPEGRILINTNQSLEAFESLGKFNIGVIDAQTIASGLGLGKTINTTILGAYCRFTKNLSLENLLSAIEEMIPTKRDANWEAARQAYERLVFYEAKS
jgi:Pyruvate/2-oxoacid:ferredoxin oxidoreductase gamma subunit